MSRLRHFSNISNTLKIFSSGRIRGFTGVSIRINGVILTYQDQDQMIRWFQWFACGDAKEKLETY